MVLKSWSFHRNIDKMNKSWTQTLEKCFYSASIGMSKTNIRPFFCLNNALQLLGVFFPKLILSITELILHDKHTFEIQGILCMDNYTAWHFVQPFNSIPKTIAKEN